MIDLGKVKPGSTIRIPFGSYAAATGASSATTNYAAADVQIYKDGNTTQRASSAGITASTDYDTQTGINLITIDLSDNTTAGFYTAGSEYIVVIADVTIDTQTVRFPAARFVIGMQGAIHETTIATLTNQTTFTLTTGAPDDNAYTNSGIYVHARASATQCCQGFVTSSNGSTKGVALAGDPSVFTMAVGDNVSIFPKVNVGSLSGLTVSLNNLINFFTATGYVNTANGIGSVSGAVGSVTSSVNVGQLAGQTVTAAAGVTFPTSVASPTNITAGTITTVTNLTNAPSAGDLTATMAATVKTQVVNALTVDTYAEPGQGTPAATTTIERKIAYVFKGWRNKKTETSSQFSLYNDDAATIDHKASVSDDGTTATVGELATGP